ncbi:uncharacterized protein PG998_003423 [Apiospora kogelbergensis]|uniref:Uncharacterized protein n=1 Tax=Apiospora kogelbergensis TaxID=1337665 RepID=A0AAW0QPT2_9PEZI
MEAAPLIKAHDHAKAAAEATHAANSTVAINEHTRAAGEFANAAKSTTSVEALRTLNLLEQHHQRLSELLKVPRQRPVSQATAENATETDEKELTPAAADGEIQSPKAEPASGEKQSQPMPTLSRQKSYPSRELGSTIASNLASARGIKTSRYRSQPLSPSVSNMEAPGNVAPSPRRSDSASKSKMQNMLDNAERPDKLSRQNSSEYRKVTPPTQSLRSPGSPTSSSEEGFSRFYNAFGSIINRISAPLAFAGLPLISEDMIEEPVQAPEISVQKKTRSKPSTSAVTEPDLSKFYSKAALKAIARDGQGPNDSFYVVPTSGHTVSYANILTFAGKEKRRMGASAHELGRVAEELDEDDFVDAKESQAPSSPGLRRKTGKTASERELSNVVEELYLENKSLKDALDQQSKRLHAFELMSQNSGMRLAESMRLMRPGSPPGVSASRSGSGDDILKKRNLELEEQLLLYTKQMEELQRDYNKARANLIRYREKWDQLKAGAKARRAGGAQGSSEVTTDDAAKSMNFT